jgi:DNA-binding response OmpR family regulator
MRNQASPSGFRFPSRRRASAVSQALRWRAMASILLIADDDWVRNDVSASIVDPSISLTVLDDPSDIVTIDRRFDLYAVDMQIASTGGMATVRLLKDAMFRGEIEPAPTVLLLDRSADVFLAKRAGADAYLIKPFTSQQLREVMSHLLGEASS